MQCDTLVIGGGLFGQVIAKALRGDGHDVKVVDCGHKDAGSKPAACLMKPSWFSSMGRDVYDPSLSLLGELYDVKTVTFEAGIKLLKVDVFWIDPRTILDESRVLRQKVLEIGRARDSWEVLTNVMRINARHVVVAAGIWTEKLFPEFKQQPQKGVAFTCSGHLPQPFIHPWAPYRQLVAFNRGPNEVWVGDGTAIKADNWTEERRRQSFERCMEHLEPRMPELQQGRETFQVLEGIRPYAKGRKPCLLEEVHPGLWLASGGAKNGTVAAGYCAHVIREALT